MDSRIPYYPRWSSLWQQLTVSLQLTIVKKSSNTAVTKTLDQALIYNSINNEMFSRIFYGFIIVGILLNYYYCLLYILISVCTYIHTYTHIHTYTYILIHMYLHIYTHLYIYTYIHTHICIYICTQLLTFLWNKNKNTCQL